MPLGSRPLGSRPLGSSPLGGNPPSPPPPLLFVDYPTLLLLALGPQPPPNPPPPPPIIVIDNEVANWLADTLGVEVYPLAIPQGTTDYPLFVYTVVDGDSFVRQDGPDGMGWVKYQLDAYSRTYADAALLVERLRLALVALVQQIKVNRGAMVGAATIRWVELHRPVNGYVPTGTGQDNRGMYRRMFEVTFHFDEDVSALERPAVGPGPGCSPPSYFAGSYFPPSYFPPSYFP